MPDIPGWDSGIHEAIRDLIGFVGWRRDLLTTDRSYPQSRQIGAAYLARTRRLVIAMDLLYEAGTPDLIGGPLRICLESWITGMWVLGVGQPSPKSAAVETRSVLEVPCGGALGAQGAYPVEIG